MSRWRGERPAAAATALLLLAAGLRAVPAGAGATPPPPGTVRDASFPDGTVNLSEGTVSLTGGSVDLSDGTVSFPTGTLAQEAAPRTDRELRFELTADLLFDFDRSDLRPEAEAVLRDVAARIKERAKRPVVRVEGHTDAKGTEGYNQKLSERRAESVRGWLVRAAKLPAKSVTAVGFGEDRPVAGNEKPDGSDDPEGRQKNRRVEIVATAGR